MFSLKISFIVSPTTGKFDRIATHNVHQAVLFVNSSGISIRIAMQLFVRWRILEGVLFNNRDKFLDFRNQVGVFCFFDFLTKSF